MSHQSLIDAALDRAAARLSGGAQTDKTASAPEGSNLIKEASEVADALEFVSMGLVNDGTPAGEARQSMVESYLQKAAAGGGPAEGATTTSGTQAMPPQAGKKKIQPGGSPSATNPEHSEAMEGTQPKDIMRQMPPATAPTPKSANLSLYDVLMNNKTAAAGGPMEMDSEQALPQTPKKNEGKQYADALLGSNEAPVRATKREAKAPTRARLAEAFAATSDTAQSAAAAKAAWPQATSKGKLKVASMVRELAEQRKEAEAIKEAECGVCGKDCPSGAEKCPHCGKDPSPSSDEKKASLGEYSELYDRALAGEFGDEAQAYVGRVESF